MIMIMMTILIIIIEILERRSWVETTNFEAHVVFV